MQAITVVEFASDEIDNLRCIAHSEILQVQVGMFHDHELLRRCARTCGNREPRPCLTPSSGSLICQIVDYLVPKSY